MSNYISYQGTYIKENVKERILNISSVYENYDLSSNSSVNIPIKEYNDSSSQKLLHPTIDEFPNIDINEILKNTPKISFGLDIKEEMFKNTSFRKFISEIENGLFSFNEEFKFSFSVKLYYQKDWEVDYLRNIILLINFYDIPFKQELELWKDLSFFIRKRFRKSKNSVNSNELVQDFNKYNNTFYIKLDLT